MSDHIEPLPNEAEPMKPEQEEESARRWVDRALGVADLRHACLAMLAFRNRYFRRSRFAEALRWSEKALALALHEAELSDIRILARSHVATDLLAMGELDRAERAIRCQERESPNSAAQLMKLKFAQARLQWRRGNLLEAIAYFETSVHDSRFRIFPVNADAARCSITLLWTLMGRAHEAQQMLVQLTDRVPLTIASRARAAVALAGGQRDEAKRLLQAAVTDAVAGKPMGFHVVVDLAWLCLEDGENLEAKGLLDHAVALQADGVTMHWVDLALRDRLRPAEQAEWEALRHRSPALTRRCPALGTPEDVKMRRASLGRPLPNLLNLLAY